MNSKLSKICINDLFDELREENNRLLNELLFAQKCIQLLESYRNCLKNFNNNCNCHQNIANKVLVNPLENQYNSVFNNQIKLGLNADVIKKNTNKNINKNNKNPKRKRNNNNYFALINEEIVIKTEKNDGIIGNETHFNENVINNNISEGIEKNLTNHKSNEEENNKSNELRNSLELHLNKCESRFSSLTVNGLTNSKKNLQFIDIYHECDLCGKTFNKKIKLNKHKRLIHSDKCRIYSCDWKGCHFETKYNEHLSKHKNRIHLGIEDKTYKCEECQKCFQSKTLLTFHTNAEHLGIRYKCDFKECKFEAKDIYSLRKHKLRHSGIKPYVCEWPGCDSRFLFRHKLMTHKNAVHNNEKQFKCVWSQCQESFTYSRALETHVNKVHLNERPFKCSKCDRSYAGFQQLRSHIRSTHNESGLQYKCEECDYKTKQSQTLKIHIRRKHTKEKPFKCQWNECESSFVTNFELQEHHKCMHSDERPFKCLWPECEASFKFKQNLMIHSRSHTGEKPNVCDWPECEKRFGTRADLKKHLSIHLKC